jgi:exosome complex RNA-binding protein Csl4
VVCPGDRIGSIRQVAPGAGAYARGGHVYASLAGRLQLVWKTAATATAAAAAAAKDQGNGESTTSFAALPPDMGRFFATVELKGVNKVIASTHVLSVGQVVLARVQRIAINQAFLEILAMAKQQQTTYSNSPADNNNNNNNVNDQAGSFALFQKEALYEGTVRREDVRTGASEEVQIQDCFLPGDLVLCRVLSLGDNSRGRYFLTTAEPDLGVLYACSAKSGKPMMPISWKEMQCVETGSKELRKCARPRDLSSLSQSILP